VSDSSVEADEDTNPEVGDDTVTHQEASSATKPKRKTRAAEAKQSVSTTTTKVEAAKTAKLEAEKKKKTKRKTSPPPVIKTLVIPTPSSREVESAEEEDEIIDDPPVVEDWTVRRLLSPTAKRQRELGQKATEDDRRQGLEAQRAATGVEARMPVLMKARPFRPKLCASATVRYGRRI
jgi:hypothetical protein